MHLLSIPCGFLDSPPVGTPSLPGWSAHLGTGGHPGAVGHPGAGGRSSPCPPSGTRRATSRTTLHGRPLAPSRGDRPDGHTDLVVLCPPDGPQPRRPRRTQPRPAGRAARRQRSRRAVHHQVRPGCPDARAGCRLLGRSRLRAPSSTSASAARGRRRGWRRSARPLTRARSSSRRITMRCSRPGPRTSRPTPSTAAPPCWSSPEGPGPAHALLQQGGQGGHLPSLGDQSDRRLLHHRGDRDADREGERQGHHGARRGREARERSALHTSGAGGPGGELTEEACRPVGRHWPAMGPGRSGPMAAFPCPAE